MAVITLAAVLAGCEAAQNPYTPLATGRAPDAASAAPESPIFATELAGPQTVLPPLPTAVVILKPWNMARNRAFCQAALALPSARQVEAQSAVAANLIRTRWLLQTGDVPASRAQDCDFLVGAYDYARADSLVRSVATLHGALTGPGPYLVMIIPGATGMHVAGLDGSAVADADMASFIAGWNSALGRAQAQIAANPDHPGLVRSVFDLVSAILSTVTGGASGLITGTLSGL